MKTHVGQLTYRQIREAAEYALAHPAETDQALWCGSACCVLGHARRLAGLPPAQRPEPGELPDNPVLLSLLYCTSSRVIPILARVSDDGVIDLSGADLSEASLRMANLREANLRGANLRGADLYGANLRKANLRGANLSEASLRCANLYGANLREANLSEANLSGAELHGANLREANLRGAELDGSKENV